MRTSLFALLLRHVCYKYRKLLIGILITFHLVPDADSSNDGTPTRLALIQRIIITTCSRLGTPVIAWTVSDDFLDHMWLIKSVPGEADTYTIRNTVGGTYMDSGGEFLTNPGY